MTKAVTIHVSSCLKKKKKKLQQNGYKGLFSAAWDRFSPFCSGQRGCTWINCVEQRPNYVGWRITQGSFCCPARTRSHPTLSCQQVFSSNSHSSKKRATPLTSLRFFCLLPLPFFCFLPSLKHKSEKMYPCRDIFGIFPVPVEVTLFPPDEDLLKKLLLTDHLLPVTPRYLKHGLTYLNCVASRNINHSTGGHKTKTSYTAFIIKQISEMSSDTVVCLHASMSH